MYAKNGEMLGFLLGFVIYRIFYKGSKLTVVSLFNLSLTAPRRYFRLRRHYFWNIYLATVSRYLTPVNLIKPSNFFSCRLRGTQLSLQDVLCWLRVINTTAIKQREEVTVHWSSTHGSKRTTMWCTCLPTPVLYPLLHISHVVYYIECIHTNDFNTNYYSHWWLFCWG